MTAILFLKASVKGHTRQVGAKVVYVAPYENRVPGAKPDAPTIRDPRQADLFAAPKAPAKPEAQDWRDETNWHSRTQGRMRTLSDDALRYIAQDATAAAVAAEAMGGSKAGQYRDEASYASMELKRRQDNAAKAKPVPDSAANAERVDAMARAVMGWIAAQPKPRGDPRSLPDINARVAQWKASMGPRFRLSADEQHEVTETVRRLARIAAASAAQPIG